jgi:hypothetical protein
MFPPICMKTFTSFQFTLAGIIACLLVHSAALAQMPSGSPAGVNAALARLFGDITAFSAKAEVQVLDKSRSETLRAPMDFALLDSKVRVDVDMNQMSGKQIPPAAAEGLKQLGMDRVVSIIRPDKKASYIIYPGVQSYVNMAMSPEESQVVNQELKTERKMLGKETIDGRPCVKHEVVIKSHTGVILEAITWNATDLKNFPVQIETREKEQISVMRFRDVQFTRPDSKRFELPAGYAAYDDPQDLVISVMKKAMGAVGTPNF